MSIGHSTSSHSAPTCPIQTCHSSPRPILPHSTILLPARPPWPNAPHRTLAPPLPGTSMPRPCAHALQPAGPWRRVNGDRRSQVHTEAVGARRIHPHSRPRPCPRPCSQPLLHSKTLLQGDERGSGEAGGLPTRQARLQAAAYAAAADGGERVSVVLAAAHGAHRGGSATPGLAPRAQALAVHERAGALAVTGRNERVAGVLRVCGLGLEADAAHAGQVSSRGAAGGGGAVAGLLRRVC